MRSLQRISLLITKRWNKTKLVFIIKITHLNTVEFKWPPGVQVQKHMGKLLNRRYMQLTFFVRLGFLVNMWIKTHALLNIYFRRKSEFTYSSKAFKKT